MTYAGEAFWGSLSKLYRRAIENESIWFYSEFKFAYLCLTIIIKMVSPWQPILFRIQLSLRWFSLLISRSISWSIAYQCVFISNGKNVTLLFKSHSNKKSDRKCFLMGLAQTKFFITSNEIIVLGLHLSQRKRIRLQCQIYSSSFDPG